MDFRTRYRQEVSKYGKKDAIHALYAYLALFAVVVVHFIIPQIFELTFFWAVINSLIAFPAIGIAIVFMIVRTKKQGLASIGFCKDRLWPGLRFGLLIALVYLGFGIVPGLMSGLEFYSLGMLVFILISHLTIAVMEDIFYAGYLQTRIYGLFKKDVPAIFAVAVLFALIHIPAVLGDGGDMVFMMILFVIMHIPLVLIFRRHFSLIPVFIAHTLSNFFMNSGIWADSEYFNVAWVFGAPLLILVVLGTSEIIRWRRAKRQS